MVSTSHHFAADMAGPGFSSPAVCRHGEQVAYSFLEACAEARGLPFLVHPFPRKIPEIQAASKHNPSTLDRPDVASGDPGRDRETQCLTPPQACSPGEHHKLLDLRYWWPLDQLYQADMPLS